MCGIFASTQGHLRVIENLAEMHYRGPDAQEFIDEGPLCVGAVRLAIVGNSFAAAQPQRSRRGNVVAFNGEIYNYRDLWSKASSEVRLLCDMLDDKVDPRLVCDGEFGILFYNPSAQTVTLYRDRFGIIPLYYSIGPGGVEVSSEARRLDCPREVPANGRVRINLRKKKARVDVWPLYGALNKGQGLSTLVDALDAAVLSRAKHTDCGFSLALSGGLDSSLVLVALMKMGKFPKACITTAFSHESDDLKHAAILCDYYKLPWLLSIISKEKMDEHQDNVEEHFDASGPVNAMRWRGGLRSYFAAQIAPTKVILCGDGADELLGGYPSHHGLTGSDDNGKRYPVARKRVSTLRSMQHFNLDRTNKMGMAWSKEYRPPLLEATLANLLLAEPFTPRKQVIRDMLRFYGAPDKIINREYKYSADELAIN